MADTNDTNDIVSEDNFIGTDEDGNSYYADDDGNVAMVDSDGSVTTESKDEQPSGNADNYEGVEETYDTDTSNGYTFDDSGNLVNADTGEAVDTSHWGDVIGEASVAAGGEKTPIAGYTYSEKANGGKGGYVRADGRKFTEEELRERLHPENANSGDKDAKAAANIAATFGPAALNNNVLDYYSKDPNAREIMSNAAAGNGAAQALIAAMTGTVPTNITDGRVYEMLADMEGRIAKGEDVKSAYENAGNKVGLTSDMAPLKATIGLIGPSLIAGPLLSAGARAVTAGRVASALNIANRANELSKVAQMSRHISITNKVGTKAVEKAIDLMNKGSKVAGIVNAGTGLAGVGLGVAGAMGNSGTGRGSSSGSPYNQPNQAAQGIINGRTREEESGDDKLAAAETTKAPTPSTTKSDPAITFSNPFGREEPEDISIPKGPLEGTALSGIGLPEPEDPKAGEERGFEYEKVEKRENSDSGDDTLETTTPDAPTGGVGTETFANPNNDNERKSWGLSEEDPNRANYDIDKWNRGMERVSTDVVSDAKCKDFVTKTYSKDPVLIKMVKIMKTKS